MDLFHLLSRRRFLAASSGLLLSSRLAGSPPRPPVKPPGLAIQGGEKAVKETPPAAARWGEPERERLEAMLRQDSLFYWRGPQTKLLVERFRRLCPLEHVMTCSSGTAAVHIAVAAAGIGPGDEVITAPITDMGSVIGVIYQQGVPVFADLEPATYNLDPASVERKITSKTPLVLASTKPQAFAHLNITEAYLFTAL
jgi:perosamine synthetase